MRKRCFLLSIALLINVSCYDQTPGILPLPVAAPHAMAAEEDSGGGSGKKNRNKAHKRSQFKRKT